MSPRWEESLISGALIGSAFAAEDVRGSFVKPWTSKESPLGIHLDEVFYSTSRVGVVRGMHVQKGRAAGHRLVFVTSGEARDFVVDLRVGSPTYGRVIETLLVPGGHCVLVPPGCAHGFESVKDATTLVYIQEGTHEPGLDIGVHWTSCGFAPKSSSPVVSTRDDALPHLKDFDSPFVWGEA